MKTSIFAYLGAALVIAALVFMSTGLSLVASAAPNDATEYVDDGLTVTKNISLRDQKIAMTLWTRQAIDGAQPMVMPVDEGPAEVDASSAEAEAVLGEPSYSPAGSANPLSTALARVAYAYDWKSPERAVQTDLMADYADLKEGTSAVYTSYIVNQWLPAQKTYPHKWIGRLSFSTTGGTSYCSATAISNNHFVTAAHCVYDTTNNRWYSNWVFTPAYRNGSAPYGTFPATSCTILTAWKNLSGSFSINTWTRYDVAVCGAGKNSSGKTLNYMVGWAGRQWNYGYVRNFYTLGYPFRNTNDALLANAGKYLRTCTAESFQKTTNTLGMGCDLSRGISGGPWLIGYALGSSNSGWVNSVNSGFYIGTANMYGARFNSNNIVPLCNTQGC
jgi:V8-like Glu-specific endopeptidase